MRRCPVGFPDHGPSQSGRRHLEASRGRRIFWAVSMGEAGNLVVACRFDSVQAYGKAVDAVNADPAFAAWQADSAASGLTTWVRSNLARAIPLD